MKALLLASFLLLGAACLAPAAEAHEYVCWPQLHPAFAHGCQEVSNLEPDCWTYLGLEPQSVCFT